MVDIFALRENPFSEVVIDQLPLKRDWLDETHNRHAYHCFPMAIANRIGWGISFPEDISFIWDGESDTTSVHVKILKGERFVNTNRSNATITFMSGFKFESEKNISLLTMPVPNQFIRGAQCITTIMSTSLAPGSLDIAWRILEPNIEITIPAGTPVAAIMPISLTYLQEHDMVVDNKPSDSPEISQYLKDRANFVNDKNSVGDWSHLYRDGIDHLGNVIGEHEAKSVKLKTTDKSKNFFKWNKR